MQADQQWREVVRGVLSHLRHAVAAGFLTLPRSGKAPHFAVQPSDRAGGKAEPDVPLEGETESFSIGPGCSGYEEVRRGQSGPM